MAAELQKPFEGGPMKKRMRRHAVVQPLDESYRLIPLTKNQNAIVDSADYDWINEWNWSALWSPVVKSFYAVRGSDKSTVYMHRLILDCAPREQGDHWNHDTLDNRRNNLRKVAPVHNHANQRLSSANTSGFKGVSWHKDAGKWMAYVKIHRRRKYLGLFSNAKEAAEAYDKAAKELFGEFAHLNFT